MRARRSSWAVAAVVLVAGGVAHAQAQDLGHKTLGTLGLDAGRVLPTGVYALDVVGAYRADRIVDRNGQTVPLGGVEATAFANQLGISGNYELPRLHTWVGAAFSAPVARVLLSTDDPRLSLDNFGFGDIYVKPLQLGWRPGRHELLVAYGFYAPTGRLEPGGRGGIGMGQWTHQFSAGGTIYFDRARSWRLSVLASYEINQRKLNVDIKRGDSVQLQGGIGKRLARVVDLGVAGYALWQVTDDTGSALPAVLAGARDVDYGLGPELDVTVPQLRTKVTARYTHDIAARSRPVGQLVLIAICVSVWSAP